MKQFSSKTKQRVGLALIAAGCCALLFLAYFIPPLLERMTSGIAVPVEDQSAGAKFKRWLRRITDPVETPSLFAFQRLAASWCDSIQVYGKQAELHPDLVFLAIDSPSFDQSDLFQGEGGHPALEMMRGGMPFPRTVYPFILERLVGAGAKVVIFDILFTAEMETDPPFREALEKYRDHVVIGSNLQDNDPKHQSSGGTATGPSPSLISGAESLYDPRVGFVNFRPEGIDLVVRRAQFRTTLNSYFQEVGDSRELLSLMAQGARAAGLRSIIPPGQDPLPFRFLIKPKPRSIYQIFVPDLWKSNFGSGEFFKNKIVLIGPYGNWSKDELSTPFGNLLGPLLHLSALNALLTKNLLHYSEAGLDSFLILLGGLVAVGIGWTVNDPIKRTAALAGCAVLLIAVAFLLYNEQNLLLNLVGPLGALLGSGLIGLVWERVLEEKEKARMRKTLERYVSKDVVAELLDNPESFLLNKGGLRKPITILFSDVRGFTTLTESADPARLVTQLNEYFAEMVRIVFAHRGTLDKFIGDAVMAHWGSFVSRGPGPDACRAVAAALDMLGALPRMNERWKLHGMAELQIGLGINHGDAICGEIGSDEKVDATAIGDAVNLASRLEGATKEFHQDLLLGESVTPLVRDHYWLRTVDLLQVKGKTRPVEVFAVAAERVGESPEPDWLAPYERGVVQFRARAFQDAAASFAEATERKPGDWLCEEYARRCREYLVEPPPEGWDGVFVMTKK